MKFLFLLLAFAFTALASIGNVGSSANLKYDGTVENVEKRYINVKNSEGSTLSAGTIVQINVADDDGASVKKATAVLDVPVCIITADCADGALCKKCQTYGIYDSALFQADQASAVAGRAFYIASTTAGYISAVSNTGSIPAGVFYDSASSSGAVQVFIKLD